MAVRELSIPSTERSSVLRADALRLIPGEEPPLGAHLVTPRRLYTHHGLYVGHGRIIHYAGLARGLHRGPVEEVSLEQFAHGRGIWVRPGTAPNFDRDQIVARARSRLGERRYRILTNKCEHFCEWCLHDESRSAQIESWQTALQSARNAVANQLAACCGPAAHCCMRLCGA